MTAVGQTKTSGYSGSEGTSGERPWAEAAHITDGASPVIWEVASFAGECAPRPWSKESIKVVLNTSATDREQNAGKLTKKNCVSSSPRCLGGWRRAWLAACTTSQHNVKFSRFAGNLSHYAVLYPGPFPPELGLETMEWWLNGNRQLVSEPIVCIYKDFFFV